MRVTRPIVRTLTVMLCASPAFATDWIVDDGSSFTESGEPALDLEEGSRARVMLCELQGGRGADCSALFGGPCSAGFGGAGVRLRDGSTMVISGDGTNLVRGGAPGLADDPSGNGGGGAAVWMSDASSARVTGALLQNGASEPVASPSRASHRAVRS